MFVRNVRGRACVWVISQVRIYIRLLFFLFEEKRVRVLDYSCWLYSSPQAILKLSQSARRQFVTVTEGGVSVHLITCIPGYICSCLEHLTWQILS